MIFFIKSKLNAFKLLIFKLNFYFKIMLKSFLVNFIVYNTLNNFFNYLYNKLTLNLYNNYFNLNLNNIKYNYY
jgi:hypothetical protein